VLQLIDVEQEQYEKVKELEGLDDETFFQYGS
jgi:hypothetical protein